MQTFLPFPDFKQSVAVLDRQRLGKQRLENMQLIKALTQGGGWSNHPAAKMWAGYELALLEYQEATCKEWVNVRGYKDTCWLKSLEFFTEEELDRYEAKEYDLPAWFGDPAFHLAHASNLLRKDNEFYAGVVGTNDPTLEYVWPSNS